MLVSLWDCSSGYEFFHWLSSKAEANLPAIPFSPEHAIPRCSIKKKDKVYKQRGTYKKAQKNFKPKEAGIIL